MIPRAMSQSVLFHPPRAFRSMPPPAAPSSSSQVEPQPHAQPEPDNNLLKVFSSLFESGKYSDLVIKCQGERWKAHKAVVCSQSKPLAAAIDGNFRESSTGEIDLEEDEPEVIKYMLEYLYTGKVNIESSPGSPENPIDLESVPQSSSPDVNMLRDLATPYGSRPQSTYNFGGTPSFTYSQASHPTQGAGTNGTGFGSPVTPPPQPYLGMGGMYRPFSMLGSVDPYLDIQPSPAAPPANPQNLATLAAIYVTAEKYDVQPLKKLAKVKYESILGSCWNTEHFVESLRLIYDGTPDMSEPDSLRELAIKTAAAHARELMDRGEFLSLCKERGDFATDVLKASLQQGLASDDHGSAIPRCRVNGNHAILVVAGGRSYNGPTTHRHKCAVCNTFLD